MAACSCVCVFTHIVQNKTKKKMVKTKPQSLMLLQLLIYVSHPVTHKLTPDLNSRWYGKVREPEQEK